MMKTSVKIFRISQLPLLIRIGEQLKQCLGSKIINFEFGSDFPINYRSGSYFSRHFGSGFGSRSFSAPK